MNIGVDYWPATTHAPGIGRYVRELVRALAALHEPPELRLLDVGPGARAIDEKLLGLASSNARRLKAKVPRRALDFAAACGLGADRLLGGCELFHGVFAGRPRVSRALRTIAVAELPERGEVLRDYDGVLVFSSFAAEELVRRCGVERERIHVVPVGCEHWKRELAVAPARDDPPTVLVLGRVDHRRAPVEILAACELLRARGVALQLVLVGRHGDAYDELRARTTRSPMVASVRFTSEPRESDMPAIVARAAVLVHISPGELTPVTPLEALAAGCAVVASRTPVLVEALGADGARWIDAPDVESPTAAPDVDALAAAIEAALRDARDPLHSAARARRAAPFTWQRHASLTMAAWRTILAQH